MNVLSNVRHWTVRPGALTHGLTSDSSFLVWSSATVFVNCDASSSAALANSTALAGVMGDSLCAAWRGEPRIMTGRRNLRLWVGPRGPQNVSSSTDSVVFSLPRLPRRLSQPWSSSSILSTSEWMAVTALSSRELFLDRRSTRSFSLSTRTSLLSWVRSRAGEGAEKVLAVGENWRCKTGKCAIPKWWRDISTAKLAKLIDFCGRLHIETNHSINVSNAWKIRKSWADYEQMTPVELFCRKRWISSRRIFNYFGHNHPIFFNRQLWILAR